MRILSIFLLAFTFFSCEDKIINEIPEKCYDEMFARIWVDSVEQEIPHEISEITGVNDNYLFGASPLGDWDFSITTDSFFIGLSSTDRFISEEEYNNLNHTKWKEIMEKEGSFDFKSKDPDYSRVLIVENEDILANDLTDDNFLSGEVETRILQSGNCHFIRVYVQANVRKDSAKVYFIEAEMLNPYGPINQ
jgi:hypothetical protein